MNTHGFFDMRTLDDDVQIRIWLGGMALDFRATRSAALAFCADWAYKRSEEIEVVTESSCDLGTLPRLPCEQLFCNSGTTGERKRGGASEILL
ncbi:hypothetical protein ACIHDR_38505 [Nocardia sp. NPDC052278]|uniref:hypothetical protein n=1 Tax=unclassified Nocardia TaxID=2637762 RepID=UPI0036BE33CC